MEQPVEVVVLPKVLNLEQSAAYKKLNIPDGNRVILCLDGGGIRGILTIQLLKKMEELAGIPLYKFCDMVAGTSTGAIISGLIASGKTAAEIEDLYVKFVTKVFKKRSPISGRYVNLPAYDKVNYRNSLADELGDITLEDACKKTGLDILITAKDVTDNEETFFTCFDHNGMNGTYRTALLRTVMETTMSAPTYFSPLERFVDGGTTTYNNPSAAAVIEVATYGGKGKYDTGKTTVFSLGTGKIVKSVSPKDAADPDGPDVLFWLNYVMDTSSQDASSMQSDLFRSKIIKGVDYRRFQVSFDTGAMGRMPARNVSHLNIKDVYWLSELTSEELKHIGMDDVSKFDLVKEIGLAMVDYIMIKNQFRSDLNDTPSGRDELVTAFNSVDIIKKQIESKDWIAEQPTA